MMTPGDQLDLGLNQGVVVRGRNGPWNPNDDLKINLGRYDS